MKRRQCLALTGTLLAGGSGCALLDSGPTAAVVGKLRCTNLSYQPREFTVALLDRNENVVYEETATVDWAPDKENAGVFVREELADLPTTPVATVQATMADQTATESLPEDDEPQRVEIRCYENGTLGITLWGACSDC